MFLYVYLTGIATSDINCRKIQKMLILIRIANIYWALTRCQELCQAPNTFSLTTLEGSWDEEVGAGELE